MECTLVSKTCKPCRGGVPPVHGEELLRLSSELDAGWRIVDEHHLEREFKLKDFREALEVTNTIGAIAEAEDHHPDILVSYGEVRVTLWTHKVDGLTENDFILAAKIDQLPIDLRT